MTGKVNYIKHLQAVAHLFEQDDRLSPWHISLYHALFHCWNDNKLQNPVSINRNEVMRLSKIGSVNTYTKALKQLSEWEYLVYEPSNNRWVGSRIYMYRFDKGTDKTTEQGRSKGSSNSSEQEPIKEVRPSIKVIKDNKELKGKKIERRESDQLSKTEDRTGSSLSRRTKSQIPIPPAIDEVKEFFISNGSYGSEGENFYNYFQSNGWLVGGKAKMKDWNAAARNWIKRAQNFKSTNRGSSGVESRLHTNNDKDYSIPL